jgi:hypothetical protein
VSDTFDVVMAAYQETGTAERDFDLLVQLVKDKAVRSEGVILVEHAADGNVRVSQTGDHLGRIQAGGGTVTLWANGTVIGEGKMPHTVPIAFSSYAGMDIGRDNGLVVDLAYEDKAPYAFTGTVKKVIFDLAPATHEDERALHEHAQAHGIGEGAAG